MFPRSPELGEVMGGKMHYVKSILVGMLFGTTALLASTVLAIMIVVSQVRQTTPGTEVGVDIRSLMRLPVLWIVALVGFGIGFYREFRRGSR